MQEGLHQPLVSQKRSSEPPTVIIVGAQFAGRRVRNLLPRDYAVILVDERDYFEYTPAVLRALVEPGHASKILVPHDKGIMVARADSIEMFNGEYEHNTRFFAVSRL